MTGLPSDHPERLVLAEEVHARQYDALDTPQRATHVAVLVDVGDRERERAHVAALCAQFDVAPPSGSTIQFSVQLGALRLKWERHGEFSGHTFFRAGSSPRPFSEPATDLLPEGWLAGIPGKTVVAAHTELLAADSEPPDAAILAEYFAGHVAVGAEIGDGAGLAYTDFRIHSDGYSRFLVLSRELTPREAGRMLQRLFEIEAYRMMALLALPIARGLAPRILAIERALTTLTTDIAGEGGDDEALLGELTKLAAEVESSLAASQSRFGASRAYYELVRTRMAELRERRLVGAQTIQGFMNRRLAPAMATCAAVSQRLQDLSERVAQASGVLSTRVDIAREKQNQALLASMERRARQQLRLQQTVEGLSIAAITYYVVGLVGYVIKAIAASGVALPVDPDLATGVAIPIVAVLVALALRRIRRSIADADGGQPPQSAR
ncbi:MAG: DUF3422 family protein [Gammaproteobacteria bacterium]